jgi:hypothetical protein
LAKAAIDRRPGSRKRSRKQQESTSYRREATAARQASQSFAPVGDEDKRDQPAAYGAAFRVEGGIIFSRLYKSCHAAVQRDSLLFFFARACRKNGVDSERREKSFGE